MGDIELGIVAIAAWSAVAWASWRTFIVEPREFRERFARNRAAARLGAKEYHPGDLWPGVLKWFGESYGERAEFIPTVGDWRSWHDNAS